MNQIKGLRYAIEAEVDLRSIDVVEINPQIGDSESLNRTLSRRLPCFKVFYQKKRRNIIAKKSSLFRKGMIEFKIL